MASSSVGVRLRVRVRVRVRVEVRVRAWGRVWVWVWVGVRVRVGYVVCGGRSANGGISGPSPALPLHLTAPGCPRLALTLNLPVDLRRALLLPWLPLPAPA